MILVIIVRLWWLLCCRLVILVGMVRILKVEGSGFGLLVMWCVICCCVCLIGVLLVCWKMNLFVSVLLGLLVLIFGLWCVICVVVG